MPETVIVALIVGVMSLPGIVLAYLTFLQTRRTLPQQTAAMTAATAQDDAETKGIDIRNYDTLYGMYKEMSFDMVKVLEKQRRQEIDLNAQAAEIVRLTQVGDDNLKRAIKAETSLVALELRTKDYPERVHLLEQEIERRNAVDADRAATRSLEAQNVHDTQTLALNAQAGAQPPQAPSANADAVTLSAPIQINVVEKSLTPDEPK